MPSGAEIRAGVGAGLGDGGSEYSRGTGDNPVHRENFDANGAAENGIGGRGSLRPGVKAGSTPCSAANASPALMMVKAASPRNSRLRAPSRVAATFLGPVGGQWSDIVLDATCRSERTPIASNNSRERPCDLRHIIFAARVMSRIMSARDAGGQPCGACRVAREASQSRPLKGLTVIDSIVPASRQRALTLIPSG